MENIKNERSVYNLFTIDINHKNELKNLLLENIDRDLLSIDGRLNDLNIEEDNDSFGKNTKLNNCKKKKNSKKK